MLRLFIFALICIVGAMVVAAIVGTIALLFGGLIYVFFGPPGGQDSLLDETANQAYSFSYGKDKVRLQRAG